MAAADDGVLGPWPGSSGDRGWSRSQVNPSDCARLLIAIMAPFPARHAVKTVEYEALVLRTRPPGPRGRRSTRVQVFREDELAVLPLDRINEVQVLGQQVEFLIRHASDSSLERLRATYQNP
jgi:hypothetical protein